MKTSWGKPVRNIGRIRTLLVTLSVAVCLATLMGCGNKPEKDASPAADAIGTVRKQAEAATRTRQAAEPGDAIAQNKLGVMYDNRNVIYNAPTLSGATQVCAARVPDGFFQSLEQLS